MVKSRKYYKFKRKYKKRNKYNKRRSHFIPMYKNPGTGAMSVIQRCVSSIDLDDLPGPDSFETGILQFQLDDINQYTRWQSIFDQYRINAVKVRFWIPRSAAPGTTYNDPFIFHTSIDLDSQDNSPGNEEQMLERANCKSFIFTTGGNNPQTVSRYVKPRTAGVVYREGVTAAYGLGNRHDWLDMKYPDIPHYGIVWFAAFPSGLSTAIKVRVDCTYWIQFRKTI